MPLLDYLENYDFALTKLLLLDYGLGLTLALRFLPFTLMDPESGCLISLADRA